MRIFTLLTFILFSVAANATHLLGGYMSYRYISGTTYEVTLTLYRDCNSATLFDGSPGSNTDAVVGIFQGNSNVLVNTLNLSNPVITALLPDSTEPCSIPPNVCREIGVYTTTVTLPSSASYTFTHERCCMPGNITNALDPGSQGSVFSLTIPGTAINTSPAINIPVQEYAHLFDTLTISNWAQDADGDSLSYSLHTPTSSGSEFAPAPNPPVGPPYPAIEWANTSYNELHQLGDASLFTIDSQTGTITAVPRWSGIYMVGISVSEWRNGTLLANYPILINITATDCNRDTTYVDTTRIPTEPVGINEMLQNHIEVFPNPANSTITVQGLWEDALVKLTDLNGRELAQSLTSNGTCTLTGLQQYAKGIYIIQAGTMRRRIVIQ